MLPFIDVFNEKKYKEDPSKSIGKYICINYSTTWWKILDELPDNFNEFIPKYIGKILSVTECPSGYIVSLEFDRCNKLRYTSVFLTK